MGTSFGRGGATTFQQDLANADVITIQGSNMAEQHPVGFQWVVEAQRRGAKVFHVDPRFTRTSAIADVHVPLRSGSDIVYLGGIINYILENGREFRDYVVQYTNAATIVDENYVDAEDADGIFSGYDPDSGSYGVSSWQYAGMEVAAASGHREMGVSAGEAHGSGGAQLEHGDPPETDPTLEHPRCVFQLLKRHYQRYTPEMVEQTCGVPQELFLQHAEALCEHSGRDRTGAFAYAVGWTQHTVGVQYIRAAAIIQLLLGNIGRPGGGILALRGHASIQGSTDIPTLYNLLPGYIPMPHAEHYGGLESYIGTNAAPTSYWANMESYFISLMKAWYGDAATQDNHWAFDNLPRIDADHSAYTFMLRMLDGGVEGFFCVGQNPAVGSANGKLHRLAMAELDWMVVRDFTMIESATFWKDSPEIESGELVTEDIGTEVFFMPAAAHTEKDGAYTNTQRLLQWHDAAVEPEGDCRSELWFFYHLGRLIREKLADSDDPTDRAILDLTWDYPLKDEPGARNRPEWGEPDAEAVLAEISGWDDDGTPLSSYTQLKDDGSTACGCWIYCGAYADGVNQPRRRKPGSEQNWVASEWAWAWPDNRRIIYNRASADPEGNPWSERKRYVWWDAEEGAWTGVDSVDFKNSKAPDYRPPEGSTAEDALSGTDPFVMQADGKGWLFVPNGLKDGPLPTHYEPQESPFANPLYAQQTNPARQSRPRKENPYHPSGDEEGADAYPFIMTTYRLTEHHTAGGMSRSVPHLSELQPEMFVEVSPELARERNLTHKGWATIITARSAIEARVLVTDRMAPLTVAGRKTHQVGLPYHWGYRGLVTGDSANDLLPIVMDPNVHISEYKTATCDIRSGRRPRGPALPAFVARHQPPTTKGIEAQSKEIEE